MSSLDRTIEYLESTEKSICDDCLSDRTDVKPRQQTNSICRMLELRGKIKRDKAQCPVCEKNKILNILSPKTEATNIVWETAPLNEDKYNAGQSLDSIRREIIITFNLIDNPIQERKERESFSQRLVRLVNAGKISEKVSIVIKILNAIRNQVVYNECKLDELDKNLIEAAWAIVQKWKKQTIASNR